MLIHKLTLHDANLLKPVVSLHTTKFNIQNFYMVLALCWGFCTYLETDSAFALQIINLLVFITEVESVYCVIQTDSLYKAYYV